MKFAGESLCQGCRLDTGVGGRVTEAEKATDLIISLKFSCIPSLQRIFLFGFNTVLKPKLNNLPHPKLSFSARRGWGPGARLRSWAGPASAPRLGVR